MLGSLLRYIFALSPAQQGPFEPQVAQAHERLGSLYFKTKGPRAMKFAEANLRRAVRLFEQLARSDPKQYLPPLGGALAK